MECVHSMLVGAAGQRRTFHIVLLFMPVRDLRRRQKRPVALARNGPLVEAFDGLA
jgi:hypothetical protein